MAVRTTRALVAGIIELDAEIVPDDDALLPFATAANVLVTECCVTNGPTTPYDDERLELIERWLTAHMYTVRDPRTVSERAGSVGGSYQSRVDLGFDVSHYGQMALRLDTGGGLARLNNDMKKGRHAVGCVWLGTDFENIPTA